MTAVFLRPVSRQHQLQRGLKAHYQDLLAWQVRPGYSSNPLFDPGRLELLLGDRFFVLQDGCPERVRGWVIDLPEPPAVRAISHAERLTLVKECCSALI